MSGTLLEVQMSKKCTPLWREAHYEVKMQKARRAAFGHSDVEKMQAVVARSTFRSQKCKKLAVSGSMRFRVADAMDSATCHKWVKRVGFAAVAKTMASVGRLKRICTDGFRVAGALRETCSSEMLGGQGTFLRSVVFWSIRPSDLLRWFCVTGAALRMTWPHVSSSKIEDGIGKESEFLMLSSSKLDEVSQN